ncbi:MAG TPA: FtsX-like permease family protein [Pseudolabrys sp.]|nr:FtsX-like permease family protein [Pseudolabrys sp.]
MRGGLRGFYVFIACIALGTMAIAGVGSLAASLSEGLAREGQVILGGDLSFNLVQREAKPDELAFLRSHGTVSQVATMRAMARSANGRAALVELKAVDQNYPLFGHARLDPRGPLDAALKEHGNVYGAAADPVLLARLGIERGARVTIGKAMIEIRAALESEPDKLAGGIAFGPRLMLSDAALRATGLVQPGSLVHWRYRLRLPPGDDNPAAVQRTVDAAHSQLPQAGWEIRTRTKASPQLERNVERFTQFLTIVGLTALLIGGVGVGNAVKSHLDRRREVIATLKAVGASGSRIFAIYLVQVVLLALLGGLIGIGLGAALPFVVAGLFGAIIPLPIEPAVHAGDLALALSYGLLIALAFALWPLGRAHDLPVGELFRDMVTPQPRWPRKLYMALTAIAVLVLAAVAILLAYDRKVAVVYIGSATAVFVLLRVVAALLMAIARRAPHARSTMLRMAVANIHRPAALTPSIVLSLGLGIALLVTVMEVDGNLRRQFSQELPAKAPAFYFLDIPSAEVTKFDDFLRTRAPFASVEDVPMLRGRIVSARGVRAEDLKPKDDTAWVLQSDRGITFADTVPDGSRLVAGKWWKSGYDGPPLVSFEKHIADGLGLRLGDTITVNVLGRDITAKIASLRRVDWQNLSINFVMVFSSNTFRGAPYTHIATLTFPNGGTAAQEGQILREVAAAFPMITAVRVKEAIDAIASVVANLLLAIRGASAITLVAAALVLGGALAAGHRHRVYDAVILKTLGATRLRLTGAYTVEYLLLGAATALFGTLSGSLAAWLIVVDLMNVPFAWLPWPALAAAGGAVVVTLILGLAGTFVALGQKPAPVLRNL